VAPALLPVIVGRLIDTLKDVWTAGAPACEQFQFTRSAGRSLALHFFKFLRESIDERS